jgi:hypothetical protein
MDIIHVTGEIVVIANGMFPIAPLPDATFAFGGTLSEIRSPVATLRENADLISRQRVAKSASPSANVQIVWRWSGSTTIASIANG